MAGSRAVRANEKGNSMRNTHVRPLFARESGLAFMRAWAGLRALTSRAAESMLLPGDHTVILPQHEQPTEDAITAELVACTLGARQRPELEADRAPLCAV